MARKKVEEVKHFTLDKDNKILVILKKDLDDISKDELKEISFHEKIGYKISILSEKPKLKKVTFTLDKAELYIKKNARKKLDEFLAFKKDADELAKKYKELYALYKDKDAENKPTEEELKSARKDMIIAERNAFKEMKLWFINNFGEEGYKDARLNY